MRFPPTSTAAQIALVAALAVLVLAVYGLGVALVAGGGVEPPLITVRLLAPATDTLVMAGQTLRVQAEATGLAVTRFELLLDGEPVTATSDLALRGETTLATHLWRPTAPGLVALSARAMTADRRLYGSAPVTVSVAPPGRITFASNRSGRYQLHTMLTSGDAIGMPSPITLDQREPAYGPGDALVWVTRGEAGADIWLGRSLGGPWTPRNLTEAPAPRSHPALSPQGDLLAYAETRQGVGELSVRPLDGGAPRRIVSGFDEIAHPSWSPDGRRIVFAGRTQRNSNIYLVNRDGTEIRRLTDDIARDDQPVWAPAGQGIAFVSERDGTPQVYLMLADGSRQAPLTRMPGGAEQPAWSPDGLWIAFVANTGLGVRNDAREIHLMRSDGSDVMRLTRNAYDDTEPAWAP